MTLTETAVASQLDAMQLSCRLHNLHCSVQLAEEAVAQRVKLATFLPPSMIKCMSHAGQQF
jgi:hypothetical protein